MSGWIRVSRDSLSHPIFQREPFTEREAWLWLIMHAAWKETHHRIGTEMVPVPRGALFATIRELQHAWGWGSDNRVRKFLDVLIGGRMIEKCSGAGKTQITICNYSKYQDCENSAGAERAHNGRTTGALNKQGNKKQEDISSLRSDIAPARSKPPRAEIQKPDGVSETLWRDFRTHRKAKGAAITETALEGFRKEAERAGVSLSDAIRISIESNWQGFRADWLKNQSHPRAGPPHSQQQRRGSAAMFDALERFFPDEPPPNNQAIPASPVRLLPGT